MVSAAEPGQFQVKYADQNESNPVNVFSADTQVISGGALAAPTGATFEAIPKAAVNMKGSPKVKGRVLIYFVSNASDTIESEESQWEIPMLIYNEQGVVVDSKTLTQENMTGFTQAGTVDIAVVVGIPMRIAYYDVPRGLHMGLDPNGRVRAYMGDDTS